MAGRARDHFAEQFLVLEPTKPSAVIFQPRCLFIRSSHVSHEWNHKSDSEFFPEKAKKSQSNATVAGFRSTKINTQEYSNLKKHLTEFWGLKEQALQFGIGGFSLRLFRLAKSSTGKCDNFALMTDGQWQLELIRAYYVPSRAKNSLGLLTILNENQIVCHMLFFLHL